MADSLHAPFDAIISRKIGHPDNAEYGLGAIAEGGWVALNEPEIAGIPQQWLQSEEERQLDVIEQQRLSDGPSTTPADLAGKTAIIVDDGIATGYTMEAAIMAMKDCHPAHVVVATPVAAPRIADHFIRIVDDVVISDAPRSFFAVGQYYDDFSPVTDEEVAKALQGSHAASRRVAR